jgi:hypothetical protein
LQATVARAAVRITNAEIFIEETYSSLFTAESAGSRCATTEMTDIGVGKVAASPLIAKVAAAIGHLWFAALVDGLAGRGAHEHGTVHGRV